MSDPAHLSKSFITIAGITEYALEVVFYTIFVLKKYLIILNFVLFNTFGFSQIEYLNFSGLTNANSISNRAIGITGETFSATITRPVGTPPDPTVSSNGDFEFSINSTSSQQCLNLPFSKGAQLYITDNSVSTNALNKKDSISFSTSGFNLTDPDSNFNSYATSIVPNVGVTYYSTWNVTFNSSTTYQICGQQINPGGTSVNKYVPVRFGVVSATLPIDLLNFKAELVDRIVELDWQTATEVDNDYFSIERTTDGLKWEEIKQIDGAGNSTILLSYKSCDRTPLVGSSYYRLKQTDFDGQYTYSKIRKVHFEIEDKLEIFPNPILSQITIQGNPLELGNVEVYDVLGQDVSSLVLKVGDGEAKLKFDLSKLKTGVYYVKTKTTTHKVYKQ